MMKRSKSCLLAIKACFAFAVCSCGEEGKPVETTEGKGEEKEAEIPKQQESPLDVEKAIKETRVRLYRIKTYLEEYALENDGSYPVGDDGSSAPLYKALSGDLTGRGGAPTGPVY